jgi:hypothetical protein
LGGPNLIVEQRGSDKVVEVVVALLFDLWMVLRTEAPAPGEIERRFEKIATNVLNLVSGKTIATLQIQDGFQHWLAMNERAVFLHDRLFHDIQRGVLPIDRNRLGEHLLQTVWAFEALEMVA